MAFSAALLQYQRVFLFIYLFISLDEALLSLRLTFGTSMDFSLVQTVDTDKINQGAIPVTL